MAGEPDFMTLAAGYDPFPVLNKMQTLPGSPLGMSPEFGNPQFSQFNQDTWYGGAGGGVSGLTQPVKPGETKPPGMAPLDPKTMQTIQAMMPKERQAQYIGGAAPRAPGQINFNVGAGAAGGGTGAASSAAASPEKRRTLAQLLGMRGA